MFLDNKYTKKYMLLIDSRKKMKRNRGDGAIYDSHHIIPKCMGGSNEKSNKVLLTPREHFICHLLLTKMVDSPLYRRSMYCALVRFLGKNSDKNSVSKNSRTYQMIIEKNRLYMTGRNNPFYGKTHSDETRKKISNYNKQHQLKEKNPFYGKTHSEYTKNLMSKLRSIPIKVYFEDGTVEEFSQYKFLGPYLGMSEHLGCKLCKPKYSYLLPKYKIKRIKKL